MASKRKEKIRLNFVMAVFSRDKCKCVMCGAAALDAHHITDRNEMPKGGYVFQNGISLCAECHIKAEAYHCNIEPEPGFWPFELYERIGSSYEEAHNASSNL